ncbi:MAG: alpha/beta hydrolase [Anaerobacillus sp.]
MVKKTEEFDYYVERLGKGETAVFLPAGGFPGNEGLNIALHLQRDYETHMIDLPGMGRGSGLSTQVTSHVMADWVKEYFDARKIDQAIVIGHSLGGAVALAFAVHYPERVKKLVLLDQGHKPFPKMPVSEFGVFGFSFPALNVMSRMVGKPFNKKMVRLFQSKKLNEDELQEKVEAFCKMTSIHQSEFVRISMRDQTRMSSEAMNLMFGFYNLNQLKLLKKLTVPTYLAYATFSGVDEKEEERTRRHIQTVKKVNKPIRLRAVESGHYVHWADNDLLQDIHSFIKTT